MKANDKSQFGVPSRWSLVLARLAEKDNKKMLEKELVEVDLLDPAPEVKIVPVKNAIRDVGMAINEGAKRIFGSMALMGNVMRKLLQKAEDFSPSLQRESKTNVEIDKAKGLRDNARKSFFTAYNVLKEWHKKEFDQHTNAIMKAENISNLNKAISDYKGFIGGLTGQDKANLQVLDTLGEKLVKEQKSLNILEYHEQDRQAKINQKKSDKELVRKINDNKLTEFSGVKEMRENIDIAKTSVRNFASNAVKDMKAVINKLKTHKVSKAEEHSGTNWENVSVSIDDFEHIPSSKGNKGREY